MNRETARISETPGEENPPGIVRTTVAYNDHLMLCHFVLKKGARIPFHEHAAVQNGYLIKGRLRILWRDGRQFDAEPGTGWCIDSNVSHGAEVLEDSEAIESFAPARPEYCVDIR
jgi:quercetin dioxygenase-like cupin family protein